MNRWCGVKIWWLFSEERKQRRKGRSTRRCNRDPTNDVLPKNRLWIVSRFAIHWYPAWWLVLLTWCCFGTSRDPSEYFHPVECFMYMDKYSRGWWYSQESFLAWMGSNMTCAVCRMRRPGNGEIHRICHSTTVKRCHNALSNRNAADGIKWALETQSSGGGIQNKKVKTKGNATGCSNCRVDAPGWSIFLQK